jgi:hypothetical protein
MVAEKTYIVNGLLNIDMNHSLNLKNFEVRATSFKQARFLIADEIIKQQKVGREFNAKYLRNRVYDTKLRINEK